MRVKIEFSGSVEQLKDWLEQGMYPHAMTVDATFQPVSPTASDELESTARRVLDGIFHDLPNFGKIPAIKIVRSITSKGLKEAKDWVEAQYPDRFPAHA